MSSEQISVSAPHNYVKRWRCIECDSENLQVAVEWMESVEDVYQEDDELGPDGSGTGDVSRVLMAFCNDCYASGEPGEVFERRRVRV